MLTTMEDGKKKGIATPLQNKVEKKQKLADTDGPKAKAKAKAKAVAKAENKFKLLLPYPGVPKKTR